MKHLKTICFSLLMLLASINMYAESSYSISEFYSVEEPAKGTKAVGRYDKVVEAEYILVPTKVDKGKYVVEVKKIGDNLYLVKGTDICVETRHCHEWASYYKEAVLIIDSNYGYNKGKLIFD